MAIGMYTLVNEERLKDVLETLHAFTGLPIQLIDAGAEKLHCFGEVPRLCTLLQHKVFEPDTCIHQYLEAGKRALELGEAYVFACHVSLNHVAFPLQSQGELLGCVIIGPFLMDTPDSTFVSGVAEDHRLAPALSLELYDALHALQVVSPQRVSLLSRLVDHLLKPLLPTERALLMQSQQKLYQQSRINETIQTYKAQGVSPAQSKLYEKETELMTKVKTGNMRQAKALLNDLLGFVLFSEGGNAESVRMLAIELTTLLSRVAMEGGAHAKTIYPLNSQYILMMSRAQSVDEMCLRLQDVVESFMSAMFGSAGKESMPIRKALTLMADQYAQPLTLPAVAAQVGLSPNYFSSLFRQTVGVSFREQLCKIRIEESKRLILCTDYTLSAIAASLGFSDQSYFCKVFKRITGITPGRYR